MIKRNYFISVEFLTHENEIKWIYTHLTRVGLFDESADVLQSATDEIKEEHNAKEVRVLAFNRC